MLSYGVVRLGFEEDGEGGCESVQEGFAADGADLAAAEFTVGQTDACHFTGPHPRIRGWEP